MESYVGRLREAIDLAGLKIDVDLVDRFLVLRHREYGSAPTFTASSSVPGVISRDVGLLERSQPGLDVAGAIGGETAVGAGQLLTGMVGNENTEGLVLRYSGPRVRSRRITREGEPIWEYRPVLGNVGVVSVVNSAMDFQVGANPGQRITVSLPSVATRSLGRKVETDTGVQNLSQVSLATPASQRDALRMIDSAIDDLSTMRGAVGATQKIGLESNLNTLRVTAENLMAADSSIRDADMAQELVEYTKNRLKLEANSALLAHANQNAGTVINLIR
jgi:flagellin